MFFNSIKEINRLRKEINRLIDTGMSNVYLNTQNFKFFLSTTYAFCFKIILKNINYN